LAIVEFGSKFDAQIGLARSDAMKQLDDGIGDTVVSVRIRPRKTLPSGQISIHRWLTQLVLTADAILQGRPASVEASVLEFSEYILELLGKDEEIALYRGQPVEPAQATQSSILIRAPLLSHPSASSPRQIQHK
jgi:hypothetical protein